MRNINLREANVPRIEVCQKKLTGSQGLSFGRHVLKNTSFVWKALRSQNTAFKGNFQPSHGTEDNLGSRHHANMTYTQVL